MKFSTYYFEQMVTLNGAKTNFAYLQKEPLKSTSSKNGPAFWSTDNPVRSSRNWRNYLPIKNIPRTFFISILIFIGAIYLDTSQLYFLSRAQKAKGQVINYYFIPRGFKQTSVTGLHLQITMPTGSTREIYLQPAILHLPYMPSFLPKVGEIINVLFTSSEEGDFHIDTFYCLWFNRLLFTCFASICLIFSLTPYFK